MAKGLQLGVYVRWLRWAIFAFFASGSIAAACEAPVGVDVLRQQVIAWINSERQAQGLSTLRESATLERSATGHACDMATRGFFGHEGPGGPDLKQRMRKVGYRYRAANENIAKTSSSSVDQVASLWRNSAGHMANVLSPTVREVGVGIVAQGGKIYWVTNSGRT